MKSKQKITLLILSIMIITLTTIASYAYFTAVVKGNSTENIVTTGSMRLEFSDGRKISALNIMPGESVTKTFKVKNVGTVSTVYDLYFSELVNTFVDRSDLVYTLSSPTGCSNTSERIVPNESNNDSKLTSSCPIEPNIEHEYTLTITFKDDGTNQDDNKGAAFSTKISVNDYKNGNLAILDNEIIENETKFKVNNIRNTPNTNLSNRTGNNYYVSNEGNDDNNGLSESTPLKTLDKVQTLLNNGTIKKGDNILFRDGDTFRGAISLNVSNILIGSYGDITKGKPLLTTSLHDGAKEGEWIEVKPNIWKYTYEGNDEIFSADIGTIWMFCNEGNNNCTKSMTTIDQKYEYATKIMSNNDYDESNIENEIDSFLTSDLQIYHVGHANSNDQTAGKEIYMYSTSNPKDRFDRIEFSQGINTINTTKPSLYVDNISIKYSGNHGIGTFTVSNLVVKNCEIGFIGGSIQSYKSDHTPIRYGNGVQIWGGVMDLSGETVNEGFYVDNSYIYQCYDAGLTFQYTKNGIAHLEKTVFTNNILEYSNYNIEYWMDSTSTDQSILDQSYIKDFLIQDNIMRYSGYGLCETRPNKGESAHIKTWYDTNNYNIIKGDFIIANNYFTESKEQFYYFRSNGDTYPTLENNTFIGKSTDYFGYNSLGKQSNMWGSKIIFDDDYLNTIFPNNNFRVTDKVECEVNTDNGISNQVAWTFDNNTKTLTIDGNGSMADYSEDNLPPWYKYKNYIQNINIGENVTKIGTYAFYNLTRVSNLKIESIELDDLQREGSTANGSNYSLSFLGQDTNGVTLTFGENVTKIPRMLIRPSGNTNDYPNIKDLIFEGNNITTVSTYGLSHYTGQLIVLPEGITSTANLSFGYGKQLFVMLPNSLVNVSDWLLSADLNLEKVIFGPEVQAINSKVFSRNNQLSEIVLPHINDTNTYSSTTLPTQALTIYGDETTQEWVNKIITASSRTNITFKNINTYTSNITSNDNISGSVGYNQSYTFNTDKEVNVYYVFTSKENGKYYYKIKAEKNGNEYTINNIKEDIYIELK